MRVSCPNCDAVYEVPDSVLASNRRLRCVRCAHEWIPSAPADVLPEFASPAELPLEEIVPEPEPEPVARPAPPLVALPPLIQNRPEPRRQAVTTVAAAWALSAVALGVFGIAAYLFRGAVQSAWPPSQLVYGALGLG